MKMGRNSKTRLEVYAKIPIQLTSENSTGERPVTAADSSNSNVLLEKRKEEANKPIYLKRV
jgi:hypothetical protein